MRRYSRAHDWKGFGLCAAFLFFAAVAAQGQDSTLEGERVLAVRVVDPSGQAPQQKIPPLPLEPGKPFDLEAERESLRVLYRTGDYADIRAEAARSDGGVSVNFIVQPMLFNNLVRIEGLHGPPNESVALAAMRLGLGEPFRQSTLKEALGRLKEALRNDGLYQAKVETSLAPHSDTRQMDVTVRVVPGPRARISKIEIRNHTEFKVEELREHSKLSPGNEVLSTRLDRGAERVRKLLVAADHLGARVSISRGDYDPSSDTLPLVMDVAAGPRVRVDITGAKISRKQVRKLVPVYAEGAVDEDLLQEGRRNLRDFFQRTGFFDVTVQYTTGTGPKEGEEVVTYSIDRGRRHRLVGISFEGNKYFSSELLASRLSIQTRSFASPGRFSQRTVQDDAASITGLYVANGFRDAKVTSEELDNYGGKEGDLFVRFHITEGSQTRVAELKFEGTQSLSEDTLRGVVGSDAGQPYSEVGVASDRDNILALYYNEGFPNARFEYRVSDAGTPDRVRLDYRISEGTRVEVERVLLTGNEHTRPGILNRQVQVKPGGPLRESDVIETQQRLYNLGIFNRVAVAPQNPQGSDPEKSVIVMTEEGKRYTIAYGGGFEVQRLAGSGSNPTSGSFSASPRGIFEISKANVGGRAQTLSFKIRASTFQYRGLVGYTIPDFFAHQKISLELIGFADKSRDINTFTSTRFEGSLQVSQRLTPTSSLLYRYFYRHVLVGSLMINPSLIPLLSLPTRVSGFGVTFLRDRRDNAADPTRGSFDTVDVSLASRSIGSSASFVRVFMQDSTFYHLTRSFSFARSVRFGVEQPIAGTSASQIALAEHLFAGGGTSLRGFGLNQAGPRDPTTGFPLGGLALLIFNQELRFPMRLPYLGNRLGGALFYDAGNVFSDIHHIDLRYTSPSPTNLDYFSHTVGFGFRYATPIGPVRLDLGYQLNPARFSFVNSTGMQQVSRLPHFQFFFNIGSIF
jgi:outer membrane protein insertion porin family